MSLQTGLVSPQFHVRFDTKFQTMRKSFGELQPTSEWQVKCGFVSGQQQKQKQVQMDVPTPPIRDLIPQQSHTEHVNVPTASQPTDPNFSMLPEEEQEGA